MSFDGWPEDYRLVTAPFQGGRMVDKPMELPVITRGLWVPYATDLTVVMKEGMTLTFMQAQGLMPLRVREVIGLGEHPHGIVAGW